MILLTPILGMERTYEDIRIFIYKGGFNRKQSRKEVESVNEGENQLYHFEITKNCHTKETDSTIDIDTFVR